MQSSEVLLRAKIVILAEVTSNHISNLKCFGLYYYLYKISIDSADLLIYNLLFNKSNTQKLGEGLHITAGQKSQ